MRANNETGMVMRYVLKLESRINALYEYLGSKYSEESDVGENSMSRTEIDNRTNELAIHEEDDVFGHRAWLAVNNDVAIANQIFEENK